MDSSCVISGLVAAAGLSERMGEFKPLMPFFGRTVIETTVGSILSGGAEHVVVVTGYRGDEVSALLSSTFGTRVILVSNPEYTKTDMMHSIRLGAAAIPACNAFFLLPGDMPVVSGNTFRALLDAYCPSDSPQIIFPTLDGYRKHPPLIDSRLIPEILAFSGSGGLRHLWKQKESMIRTVPVDDPGVWVDLDTQEDFLRCREKYDGPSAHS